MFLLDDHELVRRGLRALLDAEDDIEVVGEASSAAGVVDLVRELRPTVAILDLYLPDGDGISLCRELRSALPDLECILLTAYDNDKSLLSATLAGASAYLLKQLRGLDIVAAVRRVAAGRPMLDLALAKRVAARTQRRTEDHRMKWLTVQQRRILELITDGKSNREIALELQLKEKTVKNYVSELLSKMGFTCRTEAAVYLARLEERESQRRETTPPVPFPSTIKGWANPGSEAYPA